jgi:Holliday junction resolvasome RuvABC endonuclease subunit
MILAIDLGNEFGWALKKPSTIESGWDRLTNGSSNHPGKKFELFRNHLRELNDIDLTEIWYEEVKRHNGLHAARAYCGYVAVLQMYAYRRGIPCSGVGVGTIKKFWTGNGRSDKEMMIKEANRRGFDTDNDNCADALALLHYVIEKPAEAGV